MNLHSGVFNPSCNPPIDLVPTLGSISFSLQLLRAQEKMKTMAYQLSYCCCLESQLNMRSNRYQTFSVSGDGFVTRVKCSPQRLCDVKRIRTNGYVHKELSPNHRIFPSPNHSLCTFCLQACKQSANGLRCWINGKAELVVGSCEQLEMSDLHCLFLFQATCRLDCPPTVFISKISPRCSRKGIINDIKQVCDSNLS